MTTAFDSREGKKTGIIVIIVALIIILILAFVFGGAEGLFGVFKFFLTLLLVFGFIGLAVYVVWILFIKKNPRNIPYENWKDYLRSAKDNGADMMNDLILTGDKFHSAKVFMTISGYLRVMGFDGKEYDMFTGKRNKSNPFEEDKIIMLQPKDHSDLIGDVYVYGISLIKKYGFYFLNSTTLDFDAIDKSVAIDTYRTLMYETLGDLKGLMDRATGLDSEFRKEQMNQKLLKIPTLSGQQPQQPTNNQQ